MTTAVIELRDAVDEATKSFTRMGVKQRGKLEKALHAAYQAGRAEGRWAAQRLDATSSQVALAWLLQSSPVTLPIPGTGSVAHLEENLGAAGLTLDEEAMTALN